jgi:hypothetical protein
VAACLPATAACCAPSGSARKRIGIRNADVGARRDLTREAALAVDQCPEAPGEASGANRRSRHTVSLRANWPRWVFTKRALAPLVLSSRSMAEYNVAEGVLPPGEVQYPLAAIAAIISWQLSEPPASANTCAAASRALSFLLAVVVGRFDLAARGAVSCTLPAAVCWAVDSGTGTSSVADGVQGAGVVSGFAPRSLDVRVRLVPTARAGGVAG